MAVILDRRVITWTKGDEAFDPPIPPQVDKPVHKLMYLFRYPLDSDYVKIAQDIADMSQTEEIKGNLTIICDVTGVGRGFMGSLREKLKGVGEKNFPIGLTITAAKGPHPESGTVPSADLAS